jgi:glutaredoxin-related protein
LKVRFFGSSVCPGCMGVFVLLNKYDVNYDYIDALDEDKEIQDFCDEHNVDELPHLQFMKDSGKIILQHTGLLKEEELVGYLTDYFPNY